MVCQGKTVAVRCPVTGRRPSNARTMSKINRFHGFKSVQMNNCSVLHHTASGRSICRASRTQPSIVCSKVAVLGAAGGIGQPLSMLLKMNNMITDLALYDIANVAGVAADLSHCNTPVKVGYASNRCQSTAWA